MVIKSGIIHRLLKPYALQVNIHDAAFLKISLDGDSQAFKDWRPWTAQSYVPVRPWGSWTKGAAIAIIILLLLAFVALLAVVIRQNCVSRPRRFGRLDESGPPKAKRSPSGRLGSSEKAGLDSVA